MSERQRQLIESYTKGIKTIDPNDPEFPNQQLHYDNCNIPQSWDYTVGNEQIIVAIVDSGLHFDHPDLQNNIFIEIGNNIKKYGRMYF